MNTSVEINRNHDEIEKRCFHALVTLMETKPIDECSTQEILELANVNKSTFYRHFRDKYDLLTSSYGQILKETLFVMDEIPYKQMFLSVYSVLKQHPNFFKNAFLSQDTNNLQNYIYDVSYQTHIKVLKQDGINPELPYYQYLIRGFLYGTINITVDWALNGMQESIETMFNLCFELMPNEFKTVIVRHYM